MQRKTILALLVGCLIAYTAYVPIPDGCDYPLTLRAHLSIMELLKTAGSINALFGGRFPTPFQFFEAFSPQPAYDELEIELTKIGGVEVAIYRPSDFGAETPGSAMIFFHGGGFTIGSIKSYAMQTATIAAKTGMLVVVPEYRLSPEHPFPAAFEDSLAVTKILLNEATKYKVNPEKIVLAGDSAGGTLAAAVSLAIGREKTPNPICMMNLIYPRLQLMNFRLPSYLQNPDSPFLDRWFMMRFILSYMGLANNMELGPLLLNNEHMKGFDQPDILDRVDGKWVPDRFKERPTQEEFNLVPKGAYNVLERHKKKIQKVASDLRLSVLAANDTLLRLLPKAHTVTCEFDPLRDDGVIFHERMKLLRMKSTFTNWEFCAHGVFNVYGKNIYPKIENAVDEMLKHVMETVQNC